MAIGESQREQVIDAMREQTEQPYPLAPSGEAEGAEGEERQRE